MAWTEITTKDIATQGEDFKYNCMASGTIKKGQALVNITDGDTADIYVISSSLATSTKFVGVAATDATKGEPVAVYGQGAICWGRGDSALTYGDYLIADEDGEFDDVGSETETAASGVAQAMNTIATAGEFKLKIIR